MENNKSKKQELSPMMKQYMEIKESHEDAILFYRLGDFYEMFYDDAVTVSRKLGLTLTSKLCGLEEKAPMCGVPVNSYETYVAKLVSLGYKVAICEQVEGNGGRNAKKGVRNREVVRVITKGTITDGSLLNEATNNYICAVYCRKNEEGICFCDVSTGDLFVTYLEDDDHYFELEDEILKFRPSEVIVSGDRTGIDILAMSLVNKIGCWIEKYTPAKFDESLDPLSINKNFSKEFMDEYEKIPSDLAKKSVIGLLTYVQHVQKKGLQRINFLQYYFKDRFMHMSANTIKNLELVETIIDKSREGSLLGVLDRTRTSMGRRLLRKWIENPLIDIEDINERLDAVQALCRNVEAREAIRSSLFGIQDIERLMTKVIFETANCKDLRLLAESMIRVIKLTNQISRWRMGKGIFSKFHCEFDDILDICELVLCSISEDPPQILEHNGCIRPGFDSEIDLSSSETAWKEEQVAQLEEMYRHETGIPKLKISHNKILGYFIEVTHAQASKLSSPKFIKKQILVNSERFITNDLKTLESRVSFGRERSKYLEFLTFENVSQSLAVMLPRFQYAAKCVAIMDVLCGFAELACENKYVRPKVDNEGIIEIKNSRHPVVEVCQPDVPFVSNDVLLDRDENRVSIITGPNMAGKSTYMRQIAIIVLMAQIGCYVPATRARIGIVDQIFTRIGASDDLSSGQSTFMVEMNEVANILEHATRDSLLILDEIGRGTSTFDGMSIARAVLEYIVQKDKLGAKSLFATHYHELTKINIEGIKNYNISVKKEGDDITFLRKIVPGGADESYGVEVAKLSGIPTWVINRAKEILVELEKSNCINKAMESSVRSIEEPKNKLETDRLRDEKVDNFIKFVDKIKNIGVEKMTPIEAMNELFKLTNEAKELE